jgi:hypothetical protein
MDLPVDHGVGRMGVAFRKRCLAAGAPWVHTARAPRLGWYATLRGSILCVLHWIVTILLIPLDLFKFASNLFLEHSFIHD